MKANQLKRKWIKIKGELKYQWGTFTDTVNYLNYQRRVRACRRSQGTTTSPTTVRDADQSTSHSAPLELQFLNLPVPYLPANTPDTTSTSRL